MARFFISGVKRNHSHENTLVCSNYGAATVLVVLDVVAVAGAEFDSGGGELASLFAGGEVGIHSRITGHAAIAAKIVATMVTKNPHFIDQCGRRASF